VKTDSHDQAAALFRASYLLDDPNLCVNSRARKIMCKACEKACPVQAIKVGVDAIELNEADCTTCGACVPVCPSGSLRLSVFDPIRFLEAADQMDELHVHCSESRDGGGGIVIPCHLMIDARLAAVATQGGKRDLILHGRPLCHECTRADAKTHASQLSQGLKRWFGDASRVVRWAKPGEEAQIKASEHLDQIQANRRNFLRLAGARAVANIFWLVPAAAGNGIESVGIYVPGEFKHELEPYQQSLAEHGKDYTWRNLALLPFMARRISESCTHCGICAERCPTGALGLAHGPGWKGIDYEALSCTNCGLCTAICPESAVAAQAAASWKDAAASRHVLSICMLGQCERCGQSFRTTDKQVCPACNNEADVDAAWMAMLGG
jgi:ferredoxin